MTFITGAAPNAGAMKLNSREDLKFVPEKKLEPGAYRIDVLSDGAYLNTVLLNLR